MNEEIRQKIIDDGLRPLRQGMGWKGIVWVLFLLAIMAVAAFAYGQQVRQGLVVTGMNDIYSWGIYIALFVFLVAVSLVGAIFSSILKLTNFEFRRPLTRIAELIAVGAILFAAVAIIADMGRPERLWQVFASGRLQSPIIWDVLVVNTYLVIGLLLLYVPMIPDLAYCRDQLQDIPKWKKKLYRVLALNWQDTPRQKALLHRAEKFLIILVIPVAVAIHTVTSWLFAVTHRPGWDSTAFGAYFVSGAFVAGVACVIVAMFVLRKAYGYHRYLTDKHFDYSGKLLVLLSLVYLYFNISEFLVPAYKMSEKKGALLEMLFIGEYSLVFWGAIVVGIILPALVPIFKKGRTPGVLTVLAVAVVIAHWAKRFAVVMPPMGNTLSPVQIVPSDWHVYNPTWEEIAVTAGIMAGALLAITVMARIFPVLPIRDISQGRFEETDEKDEQGRQAFELMVEQHGRQDHE